MGFLSGKIVNAMDGLPIKGAVISIYRKSGKSRQISCTKGQGQYNLIVGNDIQCLLIEADGYQSRIVDPGTLETAPEFSMSPYISSSQPTNDNGQPVTSASTIINPANPGGPIVTTLEKNIAGIPVWVWATAGGLTILGAGSQKKVGDINYTPIIIGGALLIGAYFLFQNIGNIFGGSAANKQNNADIQAGSTAAQQTSLQASQAAGIPQTLSASQANSLATDIYNQGNTGNASSNMLASDQAQAQIYQDIIQTNNVTDWYALQNAFGTKTSCVAFSMGCQTYTLDTWIKAVCGPSTIAEINSWFALNGFGYTL
jgi:hypothetical protein